MEDKGAFYLGFAFTIGVIGTSVYFVLGWPGLAIMYGTLLLTALFQIRELLYDVGQAIINKMNNPNQ